MRQRRHALPAILTLALFVGISTLPGGIGQVGRTGSSGGGSATATVNPDFTVTIVSGQLVEDRIINDPNSLCNTIDMDPLFTCAAITPSNPFNPDDVTFQVLRQTSTEVSALKVSATDPNIDSAGVGIGDGRMRTHFTKPTGTNNDGNYRLKIRTKNGPPLDVDIPTGVPATDTLPEILGAIESALTAAGFTVWTTSDSFEVTNPGDEITAVRVEYTDSDQDGKPIFAKLEGKTSIPTLSQYGMFLFISLLTGAAFLMLRRKRRGTS